MLIPFFAALVYGAQTVVDKFALSKRRIRLSLYVPALFFYLFFFSALLTPFFGMVNWQLLFFPQILFLFLTLLVLAITWNIFYYQSLQKEELFEFETILMLAPLITILLSWIFFPETWNLRVGVAGLVAGLALIWSHWEKHHFTLGHYSLNLLVAVVLMAVEEIVATQLLRSGVFSPVSLYAIRTLLLFGFFYAYFRPKLDASNRSKLNVISLAGLLGAAYMVLKYYGYQKLGIPFTALVTIAAPITVYLGSAFVIRERMRARVLVAAAVVAACIVYATSIVVK